jgi:hypothetical protein
MPPNEAATVSAEAAFLPMPAVPRVQPNCPTASAGSKTSSARRPIHRSARPPHRFAALGASTLRSRDADRNDPDSTNGANLQRNRFDTHHASLTADASVCQPRDSRTLIATNDEVERREVASTKSEADLSQSSTSLFGSPKTQPSRSLEPIVRCHQL